MSLLRGFGSRSKLKSWLEEIRQNWQAPPSFQIPQEKLAHLAIICDGNRRAARARGLNPYFGHRAGVEVVKEIFRTCRRWKLPTLTFWVWSTKNWQREEKQVRYIMNLAAIHLNRREYQEELVENKTRFIHLGRKDRLPGRVKEALEKLEEATRKFDRYRLNLAMDYGGEDELARAIGEIIEAKIPAQKIKNNPEMILQFLDTRDQPPVDLVIRTGIHGGEIPHTSGFMPLQAADACWEFIPDLFPDLTPQVLLESIKKFLQYERRKGR
ncbi:di-trans,poly-cis-decaprenylcistransferase [bacterium]|nr:di-trans,poly-cis-decaprenylcistransferase [bacterium]